MELMYLAPEKSFQENTSVVGCPFHVGNVLTILAVCDFIFWCSSWLSLIPRESMEVSFSFLCNDMHFKQKKT